MSKPTLSKEQIDQITIKIKQYFNEELDQELGGFEAQFLLDFFGKEIGAFYYNQGLSDAHSLYVERSEELSYLIQELEKPTC